MKRPIKPEPPVSIVLDPSLDDDCAPFNTELSLWRNLFATLIERGHKLSKNIRFNVIDGAVCELAEHEDEMGERHGVRNVIARFEDDASAVAALKEAGFTLDGDEWFAKKAEA